MSVCLPKSGSSSKPSLPYRLVCIIHKLFNARMLGLVSIAVSIVAMLSMYYFYLDGLYLVDDILEGNGPRELSLDERFTIRVIAPLNWEDLNSFVLEYSICPSVYEIQIIWTQEENHPPMSYFKFPHTHSKVSFHLRSPKSHPNILTVLYGDMNIDTENVLLIDADVYAPCDSLHLAHSVWRSSRDAMVGFFPRHLSRQKNNYNKQSITNNNGGEGLLIERNDQKNIDDYNVIHRYNLEGWTGIMWNNAYSIMLTAGLMLKKEHLQSLQQQHNSGHHRHHPSSQGLAALHSFLTHYPFCVDLAIPIWTIARNLNTLSDYDNDSVATTAASSSSNSKAVPPIWVDAPGITIRTGVPLTSPYPPPSLDSSHYYYHNNSSSSNYSSNSSENSRNNHNRHHLRNKTVKMPLASDMQTFCTSELIHLLCIDTCICPHHHHNDNKNPKQQKQQQVCLPTSNIAVPTANYKSTAAKHHLFW